MSCLLLFDIDGTLVKFKEKHSSNIFIDMFKDIFNEDISLSDLPSFDGATDISILINMADVIGVSHKDVYDSIDKIWEYLYTRFLKITNQQNLKLLSNSNLLLDDLSRNTKVDLALLTGNFKSNAYLKLSTYDIDKHFYFGAFGDDAENRNDLPAIAFERAAKHLDKKIPPANTIIIGDSIKDIECAKSNGLKVIAVSTGRTEHSVLKEHEPDVLLNDLYDISKFKESLNKLDIEI